MKKSDDKKLTGSVLRKLESDLRKLEKSNDYLEKEKEKLMIQKDKIRKKIAKEKEILKLKDKIKNIRN